MFSPGYSIEWKGKKIETQKTLIQENRKDESVDYSLEKNELNELKNDTLINENIVENSDVRISNSNTNSKRKLPDFKSNKLVKHNEINDLKKVSTKDNENSGPTLFAPESGIVSLAFSLVSIAGWILFFSNATFFTFAVVIGFGILGIIFGAIAIKEHNRFPYKYLRKWPSYLGFWFSFASTILFTGLTLLIYIALMNWGG